MENGEIINIFGLTGEDYFLCRFFLDSSWDQELKNLVGELPTVVFGHHVRLIYGHIFFVINYPYQKIYESSFEELARVAKNELLDIYEELEYRTGETVMHPFP